MSASTHPDLRGLYDAHVGAALKLARTLLRDAAAAEDVAQEAFVRVNRALLERKEPLAHPRAYVLATVRNLALKELRRRAREAKAKQGLGLQPRDPSPADQGPLVQRALDQLAPDLRSVLLLRHVHGLPYAELTQALELSERTIRNRLRTAAVLFARTLKRLQSEEDV